MSDELKEVGINLQKEVVRTGNHSKHMDLIWKVEELFRDTTS